MTEPQSAKARWLQLLTSQAMDAESANFLILSSACFWRSQARRASTTPEALLGRGLNASSSAGLERGALCRKPSGGSGVRGQPQMLRSDHAPERCQKMEAGK
jgi:hypothetical protein